MAVEFLPPCPRNPTDLLFSVWTLLELKRIEEATPIVRKCRRALANCADDFDASQLVEAIGCYLAQSGKWDEAEHVWTLGTGLMPFAPNAWEGLVKIHALRSFLQANEAFAYINDDEFWTDESSGLLPQVMRRARPMYDVTFHRYAKHLAKVVPAKERWRFGL